MQHSVFVIVVLEARRCVDSESLMPSHCSRWEKYESVLAHRNELDVVDLAVLALRGWLRMRRIPGLVFHPEGFVIGTPVDNNVSQEISRVLYIPHLT